MPSVKTGPLTSGQMSVAAAAWRKIGARLEQERERINREIKSTPPPIPACDAQFNHLLEQRARICEELDRMRQAANESIAPRESIERIDEFLGSSNYIGDDAKQAIRSWLYDRLGETVNSER